MGVKVLSPSKHSKRCPHTNVITVNAIHYTCLKSKTGLKDSLKVVLAGPACCLFITGHFAYKVSTILVFVLVQKSLSLRLRSYFWVLCND